jgi:transposase
MDSSWNGSTASMCQAEHVWCFSESPYQKESDMNATIVAVDLAKNIFELAVADADWHIAQRQRLTRTKFLGFFVQLAPCQVVMEACGSAHYWARRINMLGHTVRLLPAHYVKAYVRRNKTDQADAAALIEAARCAEIREVPIKTVEAQQIQSLHRLRSQWMSARQRYVNTLRGILREFGFAIPLGVNVAKEQIGVALADADSEVPQALRATLAEMLQEIRSLEQKILDVEHQLNALTRADVRVQQLRQIPGIGALTSTALRAVVGDIQRFPSGRHFASWLGLTPNERSSAEKRRLGKISKQGDTYLRTLLVHGARSALLAAHRAERAGHSLDRLRRWALDCERQRSHNKATVALANRLARIVWATWKYERAFDGNWSAAA